MKQLTLAAALLALCGSASAATLSITVEGLRNDAGQLLLAVFDKAAAFETMNSSQAVASLAQQARGKQMTFTFNDLPAGRYAVAIHHDENRNQRMDLKGMRPKEGYAYSNGKGRMKEPDFADAAVDLDDKGHRQNVKLIYHGR